MAIIHVPRPAAAAAFATVLAATLAGCGGGGGDPPVELAIDYGAVQTTGASYAFLTGESFVPPGSSCPASDDYIRIGALGPHSLSAVNTTTGLSYPVFDQLWVCNSEDGRTMHWQSNPIDLAPGSNQITVTMTAGGRSSSASVTVVRSGG
jgi:hypothetical protein